MLYIKQVVEFKDGKFGLRRLTFTGYEFLDISSGSDRTNWYKSKSSYMNHSCRGSLEQVVKTVDVGKRVSRKRVNQTRVVNALKGDQ